jgi:WD40 repeat protein
MRRLCFTVAVLCCAAEPRLDRHDDPLPEGALQRLGTVRFRQRSPGAVVWSPDGKLLVGLPHVRGSDLHVEAVVWDATTGRAAYRLPGVVAAAFAPDGATLAVQDAEIRDRKAEPIKVRLLDARTGQERLALDPYRRAPFAFSPDGKRLACGTKTGHVTAVDSTTGKAVEGPRMALPGVQALAWSSDGKRLYTFEGGRFVRTLDAGRWQTLTGVVLGEGDRQLFWDEEVYRGGVVLAAGARFIAGGGSRDYRLKPQKATAAKVEVWVWDLDEGKEVRRWPGVRYRFGPAEEDETEVPAGAVALSGDGRSLAWADWPGRVTLADVRSGAQRRLSAVPWETTGLAFSPDGRTLAGACPDGNTITFWDAASGADAGEPGGHRGPVLGLDVAPDGRLIATGGRDATIRLWERGTGAHIRTLTGHGHDVSGVRFTPDGKRLVSVSTDGSARTWDVATGREVAALRQTHKDVRPQELPHTVWVSADGAKAAALIAPERTSEEEMIRRQWPRELRVWDAATSKPLVQALTPATFNPMMAFAPDGRVAAMTQPLTSPTVTLLDLTTGKDAGALPVRFEGGVTGLAFSPDGRWLAVASYQAGIHVFDAATRQAAWSLKSAETVTQIAFSPDGRYLASAALGQRDLGSPLRLTELATGRPVWSATAPGQIFAGTVAPLVFTPDGKALLSGGGLTEAFVWGLGPASWRGGAPPAPGRADLERAWEALAGGDAEKAYEAGWLLSAHAGPAVPFLKARLRPAEAPAAGRLHRLIADLDGNDFQAREGAARELKALDGAADAGVREALKAGPPLETARRLEEVLASSGPVGVTGEALRRLRAVVALERAGTAEARSLLAELAGGAADARLTREAKAALSRLGPQR